MSDSNTDSFFNDNDSETDTASDTDLDSSSEEVDINTDADNNLLNDEVRHPPLILPRRNGQSPCETTLAETLQPQDVKPS